MSPQWSQLQAEFVDDPESAVRGAAELVQEAVRRLEAGTRGGDKGRDTEALRSAFLMYRELHRTLTR